MGRCRTCNDELAAPVYREGDEWFCSLKCWELKEQVSEMQKRDEQPRP